MTANKKKKRKKQRHVGRHIGLFLLAMSLIMALGLFGGLTLFKMKTGVSIFTCISEGKAIAADSKESDFTKDQKTYLYAADGTLLTDLSEGSKSTYLTYDQIPKACVDAFVAVEDRSFWTNNGTDPKGIARVIYTFIKTGGKTANGASTITQQLVKLTYLSTEKTLSRKVKEIVISSEITKKYTKEQIIEYYCNTCCFANGIYGLEDASQAYFGKSVSDLTLSQMAYLCAIPNWPEHYNPKTKPENAIKRRDKILKDMLEEDYITQSEYDAAIAEEISIYTPGEDEDTTHNYETTYAINCAVRYIMQLQEFEFCYEFDSEEDYKTYQELYSEAYAAAKHELYTGGYKVYTTIDLDTQKQMQQVLDEQLASKTATLDNGIYQVQGAMTVIDNASGKVISIIGGRSQKETQGMYTLNRAYQGYFQPGSSIKPLVVYAPALDSGNYNTYSKLQNIDVTEAKSTKASVAQIKEMEGTEVPLRSAVENSLNGCAYWLFANTGVSKGLSYLKEMGFSRIVSQDYTMSACLGGLTYGVTTEEMANAYYTLQNDGIYKDTDCLAQILDKSGNNIYVEPESKQVYGTEASRRMVDVMKGVLTNGTAKRSSWYSYTATEAAGKTGTTNDNKAAWFCGFTPYYTIAVWVGCDTPTTVDGLTGSSYPLSIWENAMLSLISGKDAAGFKAMDEEPEKVLTCTCVIRCTETGVEQTCEVCAEDPTKCECQVEGVCICSEKCDGDSLDEACAVCMRNFEDCTAPEPECCCEHLCTEDMIDQGCIVCQKDRSLCKGLPASEEPQQTEDPAAGSDPENGGSTGGEPSGNQEQPGTTEPGTAEGNQGDNGQTTDPGQSGQDSDHQEGSENGTDPEDTPATTGEGPTDSQP